MNIESTAQSAPTTHREPISRSLILGVFLRNGFRIEDGRDDLPDCVYEAAFDLAGALGAPAVQGEPMAWQLRTPDERVILHKEFPAWADSADGYKITPLYAAPQPASHQPISHDWDDQDKCRRCGDRDWYASATCTPKQQPELAKYQPCGCVICTCEHETRCQGCGAHHCGTHPVGQFPEPAYQQPAPDVTGLVIARGDAMRFALSEMVKWYESISLGNNPAFQYYDLAKKALLSAAAHPVGQFSKPAYQQPAPDVARLMVALERALDFIRGDGNFEHREPLELCECYSCVTGEIIDSLAAHRKGGEG